MPISTVGSVHFGSGGFVCGPLEQQVECVCWLCVVASLSVFALAQLYTASYVEGVGLFWVLIAL